MATAFFNRLAGEEALAASAGIRPADRVITMGCGVEEVCPASFVPAEDWELEDPAGKPAGRVREIRDEIKSRVEGLVQDLRH